MTKQQIERHTQIVKRLGYETGFQYVGVSKAAFLEAEAPKLEEWLKRNYQGKMGYLENHFDKRLDPTKLVEGAKSVITLLYQYHNPSKQRDVDAPKISQYAYGKDYHHIIKAKLKGLFAQLQAEIGHIEGRVFVDSAPVMERAWAAKSGTGWIGKHGLLLTREAGSYFFLAELITDLELTPDGPIKDYCGTCTRCIDACPTQAIVAPEVLDASKCISYLTIELKDDIPTEFTNKMDNWMFGCDVCQEVCPWNRFAKRHNEPAFEPHPDLLGMNKQAWTEMTKETFNEIFRKSAVKRTKYEGLKRNIAFLEKKRATLE